MKQKKNKRKNFKPFFSAPDHSIQDTLRMAQSGEIKPLKNLELILTIRTQVSLKKIENDYWTRALIIELDLCLGHNGKTAYTVDSLNEKLQAFDLYGIPRNEIKFTWKHTSYILL